MGILDKIGGSEMQQMMLFMFLGIVVAILVLGFHRSPRAAPNPRGTGLNPITQTTSMPQTNKGNQNPNIGKRTTGGYL